MLSQFKGVAFNLSRKLTARIHLGRVLALENLRVSFSRPNLVPRSKLCGGPDRTLVAALSNQLVEDRLTITSLCIQQRVLFPILGINRYRLVLGLESLRVLGQLLEVKIMLDAIFVPPPHIIVALLQLQLLKLSLII